MSTQLIKLLAPAVLFFAAGTASAGHGGGGHGGGGHGGGHGGHGGGHHGGFGGHHGGYVHRGYYSNYGYGGYGYGLGYGNYGYGLGYGNYGYGYGGYSYPYYGYSYPAGGYYPNNYYPLPTTVGGGVVPASGVYPVDPTPAPSAVAAPATVTVVVPEGAQVSFDGKDATGTGTERVFTSPAIQPTQPGVLAIKASWGGNTYSMQLSIRAGDKMRVDLR